MDQTIKTPSTQAFQTAGGQIVNCQIVYAPYHYNPPEKSDNLAKAKKSSTFVSKIFKIMGRNRKFAGLKKNNTFAIAFSKKRRLPNGVMVTQQILYLSDYRLC